MTWCVAVGCSSNSFMKKRVKGLRFFQLPKNESLKKRWLQNIKRDNLLKNPSVCELHFEENCFKRNLQVRIWIKDLKNCKANSKTRLNKDDSTRSKKTKFPQRPDEDYLPASNLDEVLKNTPDHGLATTFKVLLHFYSQELGNCMMPRYVTFPYRVGNLQGFIGQVDYKGNIFQSLGLMATQRQAELSAAEICLRCLGCLPPVDNEDKFIIQPYRGGYWGEMQPRYHALLANVLNDFGFQGPKLRVKATGKDIKAYTSIILVEGKAFESDTSSMRIQVAQHKTSKIIFKYVGIENPELILRCCKFYKLRKKKMFISLVGLNSPFTYSPGEQKGWVYTCLKNDQLNMTGEDVDTETRKLTFETEEGAPEDTFERVTGLEPMFQGQLLKEMKDLTVGEAFPDNPDLLLIGNKNFSILMHCKGKKIFCENRGKEVAIMPGHHIIDLKCSYKVSFPSLQVYLKAERCTDLHFPNPPLPVVTECKGVIMMYDHEAGGDVYILLKRNLKEHNFISCAYTLKWYLEKILESDPSSCSLDVPSLTKDINSWSSRQIELLSEMTLESMQELFSTLFKYDERCNEIFFQELPPDLKQFKDICKNELEKRKNQKITDPVAANQPWSLPSSRFNHRFTASGLFIESDIFCMHGAVRKETGLRIKLNEIESSKVCDEPNKTNKNPHRGDVTRYFIWSRFKPTSRGEKDTYFEEEEQALDESGEKWVEKDSHPNPADASTVQNEDGKEISVYSMEKTEEILQAELQQDETQEAEEIKTEETCGSNMHLVNEECCWFKVEEVQQLCSEFAQISSNEIFVKELQKLKEDAEEFASKKK